MVSYRTQHYYNFHLNEGKKSFEVSFWRMKFWDLYVTVICLTSAISDGNRLDKINWNIFWISRYVAAHSALIPCKLSIMYLFMLFTSIFEFFSCFSILSNGSNARHHKKHVRYIFHQMRTFIRRHEYEQYSVYDKFIVKNNLEWSEHHQRTFHWHNQALIKCLMVCLLKFNFSFIRYVRLNN